MDSTVILKTLDVLVKIECDLLCKCFTLYLDLIARFRQSNATLKEPKTIQVFFLTLTEIAKIHAHIMYKSALAPTIGNVKLKVTINLGMESPNFLISLCRCIRNIIFVV